MNSLKTDLAEPIGVSITWLDPNGIMTEHPAWGKRSEDPKKQFFGVVGGGAVWLAPPGETLFVAEGIETALAPYFFGFGLLLLFLAIPIGWPTLRSLRLTS